MSDHYTSPLSERYASAQMSEIFSPHARARVWRRLWVALARAEKELGVSDEQVHELEEKVDAVDLNAVSEYERRFRHDVMAHIHAYGDQCPKAKGIIHLGATSTFVTDNGDLILMREALSLLERKVAQVIRYLLEMAKSYRDLPCLSYTHLQPAQPTTLGKRACLWAQDLFIDLQGLHSLDLPFLGVKGATGTQASFLQLFKGDHAKVLLLEEEVARELGFEKVAPIASQTYSRKWDVALLDLLSGIAVSAHKFATDLRLLASKGEMGEPFEAEQVGSSAMPHKRNPILSERCCALSRFVISLSDNARQTAANQWLERSLDDSANRRLTLPEAFLTTDAILNLLLHLTANPVIYPEKIDQHLNDAFPSLVSESILMAQTLKGGDRQEVHGKLRHLCHEKQGKELLKALQKAFPGDVPSKPQELVGRAPEQVDGFVAEVEPLLASYPEIELTPVAF